jgi:hypothetical protein
MLKLCRAVIRGVEIPYSAVRIDPNPEVGCEDIASRLDPSGCGGATPAASAYSPKSLRQCNITPVSKGGLSTEG